MKLVNQEKLLKTAAAKAGMSEKTARKYRKSGKLPSHQSFFPFVEIRGFFMSGAGGASVAGSHCFKRLMTLEFPGSAATLCHSWGSF